MKKFSQKLKTVLSFMLTLALILGLTPMLVYSAAPLVSPNLTYTANADGTGTLDWSSGADATDITGYKIVYADGAYTSVFNDLTTVPKDQTSYTIPADSAHKWSYYQVHAYNESGETASSSTVGRETTVFGPDTYIFNAEVDDIPTINSLFDTQSRPLTNRGEFATNRYAVLFKPGTYDSNVIIGYYMHVAGLGLTPAETVVNKVYRTSGGTTTFWRTIENLTYSAEGEITYPVSQAAPIRRVYVPNATSWRFDIARSENNENSAWVSGGYLADSYVPSGRVGSWTQQQWYFRNNDAINYFFEPRCHTMLFQGCTGSMENVNSHENTVVESTPVIAEKPYLYFKDNEYYVFVPGLEHNKIGHSWTATDPGPGTSLKLEDNFLIARPNVTTVTQVNDAIAAGKNIFFTPGIYYYDKAITVNRPNTIILGYGMATISPTAGNNAINVGDVAGVRLAGLFLDAGSGFNPDTHYNSSYAMLQVGEKDTDFDAGDNPVIISDVFVRVGGPGTVNGIPGRTAPFKSDNGFVINTSNTIIDHTWIWRADHGTSTGWYNNETDYGIVVNGDHVTTYGLMVEHFNKYDVLWNGEYGRLYFLQNEKVYIPVSQANYQGPEEDRRFIYDLGEAPYDPEGDGRYGLPGEYGTTNGWAAVRVADHVYNWDGWALGCYDVYRTNRNMSISSSNAVVTPLYGNINVEHFIQLYLSEQAGGGLGSGWEYMVNGVGKGTQYGMGKTSGASYLLPSNPFDNGKPNEWHSMKADADKIIYFEPVEVTTPINTAPVLPTTAKVRYGDGSWGTVTVSWPAIDPADYAAVGKSTTHIGTILDGEIQTGPLGPATFARLKLKVEGNAINISAVSTLVLGCTYRLKVDVSIDGLDTAKNPNIQYYLYNADTRAQLDSSTDIASFPLVYTDTDLEQDINSIPRMYILVRWSGDTEYRNTHTINVVPLNPDIWTVQLQNNNGKLSILFADVIGASAKGGLSVDIGSEKNVGYTLGEKVVNTSMDYDAIANDTKIVIKGVRYPHLFPSYAFTFTKLFTKEP